MQQLTPDQERFLVELFKLCDRFKSFGIDCSSLGFIEGIYEIRVQVRPDKSPEKS